MSLGDHSGTERAKLDLPPTKDMDDTVQIGQNEETEKKTEMEPHILLLQACFGQEFAERFLDPSSGIPVSPVQPLNLQTEGCGAKEYWRLLREHSEAQLMQEIADVPGAFMVKRSSLNHLTTSKHLDQIKDYRRKLWLMSRASEMNEEKTILLMTNNPLPDVSEWQNTRSLCMNLHKDTYLIKKINQLDKSLCLPPVKTTNSVCTRNEDINVTTTSVGNQYRFLTEETFHGFKGEFSKRCNHKHFQRQRSSLKGPSNYFTFIQQSNMHADENG